MDIKNINYKIDNFKLKIDHLVLSNELNLLYGESGSGKSTLVDLLIGYRRAKGMSWTLNGVNMAGLKVKDKKIGLVLQKGEVFPHLSGIECLNFAAEARNVAIDAFQRDLQDFTQSLNISREKLDQQTSTLSGGEKQRLSIMCALIGRPNVLILDEPFSALDSTNKENAFRLVKDFSSQRKVPALIVSHDMSLLENIDRKFELSNGSIVT